MISAISSTTDANALATRASRRNAKWLISMAIVSSFALSAATSHAAEPSRADALFREGRTLLDAKRYDEACAKLGESLRLEPGAGTLVALALCHEGQGKRATAHADLVKAAELGRRVGRNDLAAAADKRASALLPNVPKIAIHMPEGDTAGYEVRCDQDLVARETLDQPILVDAGEHTIGVSAKGYVPRSYVVRVSGAARTDVNVERLDRERDAIAVTPVLAASTSNMHGLDVPSGPSSDGDKQRGGTQRALGLIVGGVGLAGFGVGGYFGVRAAMDRAEGRNASTNDANDRSKANFTVAIASLAAGAGVLATGAIIYFTAPRGTSRSAYIAPDAGPRHATLNFGGTF